MPRLTHRRAPALLLYEWSVRLRNKLFSASLRRSFASFGAKSVVQLPARMYGVERISIGQGVLVGSGSWLEASDGGRLSLGDGVRIVGRCTITARAQVTIEDHVLIAAGVYISDHSHARSDRSTPIVHQGVTPPLPIRVCSGAWLGQNAVLLPGVTIGRNAVVGANAVVNIDVPDHAVAVGAPAKLLGARAPADE